MPLITLFLKSLMSTLTQKLLVQGDFQTSNNSVLCKCALFSLFVYQANHHTYAKNVDTQVWGDNDRVFFFRGPQTFRLKLCELSFSKKKCHDSFHWLHFTVLTMWQWVGDCENSFSFSKMVKAFLTMHSFKPRHTGFKLDFSRFSR